VNFCGQCGAEIDPQGAFCGTCGVTIPRVVVPNAGRQENVASLLIIGLVLFGVLVVGIAVTAIKEDVDKDPASGKTRSAKPNNANGSSRSRSADPEASEPEIEPWVPDDVEEENAIGSFRSGSLRLLVTDIYIDPHTTLKDAKRGHTFVWLELDLTNMDDSRDLNVDLADFQLLAKQLRVDAEEMGSGGSLPTISSGTLVPGEHMSGWMLFEAKIADDYTLFHDNGKEEVSLDFSAP